MAVAAVLVFGVAITGCPAYSDDPLRRTKQIIPKALEDQQAPVEEPRETDPSDKEAPPAP